MGWRAWPAVVLVEVVVAVTALEDSVTAQLLDILLLLLLVVLLLLLLLLLLQLMILFTMMPCLFRSLPPPAPVMLLR